MPQAVCALAERVDPTSYRRYALPDVEVEPLHKGRIDLPAAGSQYLPDRLMRPEHHPMLDVDHAPAPVRFHDLRIEQPGLWHPARLRVWALGLTLFWLHPLTKMAQERRA